MGELESDTMHITRGVDENCAKVDAPSERKMRGLLLRYMLYDALVRPSEWQFAPAFDAARVSAWETALRALFQRLADDSSGQLPIHMASLEAPRQISIVPLLAARAAASSSATIAAYEPIRPTAAALRSAASDNDLDAVLHVIPISASRYKKLKSEDARASVLLCPGVEDITSFFDCLVELHSARPLVARGGAVVLPAQARLVAAALHIPSQSAAVRTPIGEVAGFDLRPFNAFRGTGPADAVRVRDIKHTMMSEPEPVVSVDLRSGGVRGETCSPLETSSAPGVPAADKGESGGGGDSEDDSDDESTPWEFKGARWRGTLRCTAAGSCSAVAFWVDCSLGGEEWDLPGGPSSRSRRQLVIFLPEEVSVVRGDALEVVVSRSAAGVQMHSCRHSHCGEDRAETGECSGRGLPTTPPATAAGPVGAREGSENASMEKWHWPMILDHRRNSAYDAAVSGTLAAYGSPSGVVGPTVLDIGGGSGLLAMMAARAGAASVTCIERIPEMAAVAESIVAANGFDQVITVLRTDSTALSELPGGTRADILLSEILDDGLLGEGVIPTIAHARRTLAVPGAVVARWPR